MTRILTVCLGNICRSPTAEAALVEAATELGVTLEVDSAGTGDWHVGHPPDTRMTAAAAAVGLELRGTGQQVDPALLTWADLVVVMDHSNLTDVTRIAAEGGVDTPVVLFRSFDPELAPDERTGAEVPDPYYGGPEGFVDVVEVCRRTARAIVGDLEAALAHARSITA
jgi:protein-tyrosine phosphatase